MTWVTVHRHYGNYPEKTKVERVNLDRCDAIERHPRTDEAIIIFRSGEIGSAWHCTEQFDEVVAHTYPPSVTVRF